MDQTPILQQALGDRWEHLSAPIREHYRIPPFSPRSTRLSGELTVEFPGWMTPIIKVVRCFGGLIEKRGCQIDTVVQKYGDSEHPGLFWIRSLSYPDGSQQHFSSCMILQPDYTLAEMIGAGFGVRLRVCEENHDLVYRSQGYLWRAGPFPVAIPDGFLLGTASIRFGAAPTPTAVHSGKAGSPQTINHRESPRGDPGKQKPG